MRPASSTFSGTVVPEHDDVHRQVRTLQHRAGRVDAAHLDVFAEALAPDPDGEHRHLRGTQPEQRFLDRGLLRVGAVGNHHEPGERQARELLLGAQQRLAQSRLRAVVGQVAGASHARRRRREAEEPDRVPRGQRLQHRAVRPERARHELAARLAVLIGHPHAARVVQQHAEEILLRHGGAQDEHRPEQAEEHDGDEAEPQRDQDGAIEQAGVARRPAVRENRDKRGSRRESRGDVDG
jgi:hypothetical protein